METCLVEFLGLLPYEQTWRYQEKVSQEIARGERCATLLLLEHPHTFTFGRRGRKENLLWDEQKLSEQNAEIYWVDRGGDVTYHGPGQLVGYPIIPLGPIQAGFPDPGHQSRGMDPPSMDYLGYLRKLEQVIIRALAAFSVQAYQIPSLTGVWVYPEQGGKAAKISSLGVKVDHLGITRHGFAINVHPDMRYWQGIIGCGLEGYAATSLAEILSLPPTITEVAQQVIVAFGEVFNYQMIELRVKL